MIRSTMFIFCALMCAAHATYTVTRRTADTARLAHALRRDAKKADNDNAQPQRPAAAADTKELASALKRENAYLHPTNQAVVTPPDNATFECDVRQFVHTTFPAEIAKVTRAIEIETVTRDLENRKLLRAFDAAMQKTKQPPVVVRSGDYGVGMLLCLIALLAIIPIVCLGVRGERKAAATRDMRIYLVAGTPDECFVCREKHDVVYALQPCGHAGLCEDCAEQVDDCPYCNRRIKDEIRIST